MADTYTTQSSSTLAKTLWSKALQFPYRDQLHYDAIANSASTTEEGFRGKEVTYTYPNELAIDATPLDEIIDPDAKTFTTSTKTVTLAEYGGVGITTALARTTGFIDVDRVLINLLGFQAGATMDLIAQNALLAGTNKQWAGTRTATNQVTATDVLTTKDLEIAYTELAAANVPSFGGNYVLFAHPYQVHDLRMDTATGGFRQILSTNSAYGSQELRNHTIGEWAGFNIVLANRTSTATDGASSAKTYKAIAVGADGFVKAYSDHPEAPGASPEVRFGHPTGPLMRSHPVGWYALLGFKIMRDASVRQLITGSSR